LINPPCFKFLREDIIRKKKDHCPYGVVPFLEIYKAKETDINAGMKRCAIVENAGSGFKKRRTDQMKET
jgi:hypothetical protein